MMNCKRLFHNAMLLFTGAALAFGWWVYMLNRPVKHSIRLHDSSSMGRDGH